MADMQQTLESLRHSADVQQGQLTNRERELEQKARHSDSLQTELRAVAEQSAGQRRELSAALADLSQMTRENQTLQQELLSVQRRCEALGADAQEQRAAQEL